ncbi:winged helix DNA-binding domain-containing protein [Nocardioides anomalus]|uniref:Winged helix DNA-binding domain-containing protein n=1 Tax=Nocardioides anomalus TaxID=2712223 RepID=A0A6G6WBM0_9ACTN|nr:winged helix DNA-binding domain-containing protein [Nocardioides anomalus]QIG42728.1 winged helix DNA-binding domain-containing protein [Nocardioides anomalus]
MQLSARALNRTLLRRQHLLARTDASVPELVRHLVGLQAQENLSPFLSLAARRESFDPREVTAGLEDRSLVRFLTLRGTVHLLVADDALRLRQWTAPVHEREIGISGSVGTAREVDREAFLAALSDLLADGPVTQKALGLALAEHFPAYSPTQLGQLARSAAPLVQCPPRGTWRGSGGVVYQYADRWLGRPFVEPDVAELVRRYLAACGPATAADVTTWSGVTRLAPVLKGLDLVVHEGPDGKALYDVPDAPLADEDAPAPVRLLGQYDNLWLSHAGRDRVTTPETRRVWQGPNGGLANTVFADGMLVGLWRAADGRVVLDEPVRPLSPAEREQLDVEVTRVEALLAVPASAG